MRHELERNPISVIKVFTEALLGDDPLIEGSGIVVRPQRICSYLANILKSIAQDAYPIEKDGVVLDGGDAIPPLEAIGCLRHDSYRVQMFLRGVRDAIREKLENNGGEKVRVLYAGCGPFATLALPLTTQFESSEVEFTLLDIHPESVTCIKKLIEELRLEEYFFGIYCCDAITYRHQGEKPNIVMTETMNSALLDEPQFPITLNLLKQTDHEGILIPENIKVFTFIQDDRGCLKVLGEVFQVNRQIGMEINRALKGAGLLLEGKMPIFTEVVIPNGVSGSIFLGTEICTFGKNSFSSIGNWRSSSLTDPIHLVDVDMNVQERTMYLNYVIGGKNEDIKWTDF